MEVIVKTYQESNLLQRIKFLARTKGDLPGLELKLSQRTDALTTWLTIQNFGKTDKLQDLLEKVSFAAGRERKRDYHLTKT